MAASIVHFGFSDCHRLHVLATGGYQVFDCGDSLKKLRHTLHRCQPAAVVFSEGDDPALLENAIEISSLSSAARILFCARFGKGRYDRCHAVVEPLTAPEDWLKIVMRTTEQTRASVLQAKTTREESNQLREQSSKVRSKSLEEKERLHSLLMEHSAPKKRIKRLPK